MTSALGRDLKSGDKFKVQGSNLGVDGIFPICPNSAWDPPGVLYDGFLVIIGSKAAAAWR